jgi:hypothetical protein
MQWELNNNAESIESEFSDGNHGHIFLVIPKAEYLVTMVKYLLASEDSTR